MASPAPRVLLRVFDLARLHGTVLIRGAAPGTKFISNLKQSERPAMATHTKWFGVAVLALTACPVLAQQGPAVSNVQFMGRGASQSPGLGTFNPGFQALKDRKSVV